MSGVLLLFPLLLRSGPFGSHVLEKCLTQLARRAASAPPEEYEAVEQVYPAAAAP
jgi:hypothetical protein